MVWGNKVLAKVVELDLSWFPVGTRRVLYYVNIARKSTISRSHYLHLDG
jgi:hypothetical protein